MSDEEQPATPSEQAGPEGPAEPTGPDAEDTGKFDLRKRAPQIARARRRAQRAEVTLRRPGEREVQLPLEGSRTLIGRDPVCDIVLKDQEVSRRHAIIEMSEGGYFELRDHDSGMGLTVKGHETDRMVLLDGDRFQIGGTKFTFHVHVEAEEG